MTLRTIGDLVGATNAARDLHGLAAAFFQRYREHANGVNGITIPNRPFVVVARSVDGTADVPTITFAIVWTERVSWQVAHYLSPDDERHSESWGADNSCGSHTESKDVTREMLVFVTARTLLLSEKEQIVMLKHWVLAERAAVAEKARQNKIANLEAELAALKNDSAARKEADRG